MGSFGGHALPGSFFLIFALWWTVQMFRRYYSSRLKAGLPYKSSVTFPVDFLSCGPVWLRRWEWEGFFKVFFTLVGFLGEIITAHEGGRFSHIGNGQHATMFFFFGMSGVIDILVHHRAPLPEGVEYVIGILAFSVEAVLFMFHLHGRTLLDVVVHTLLVYVVYGNIIFSALELKYRHSITIALARAYTVLLQGTWFWQVGFILYNPIHGAVPWQEDNHEHVMVVTMIFAWHMAAAFVVMVSIGAVVAACQSSRCCHGTSGGGLHVPIEPVNGDGMRLLRHKTSPAVAAGAGESYDVELDSDSDDTVDFIRPATSSLRPTDDATH